VAFTAPVPRPPRRLSANAATAEWRSHATLGLRRFCTVSLRRSPTHQTSFRATRSLTLSCQSPSRLGPRSLSPPLFLERCVGAYSRPGCCLPTSATAYDVRTKNPGLSFPRRDGGHDHLPFLTSLARPTRVTPSSGETRRAAHSSVRSDLGAGSSWLPRFARPRYRTDRCTPPPLA